MKISNPYHSLVSLISVFALLIANLGFFDGRASEVVFIGHRGYCSEYLENTTESFEKAAEVGFGGCETDVRVAADGTLMLSHAGSYLYEDGTSLEVAEHTYEELTAKPLYNEFTDTVLYACTFAEFVEIMASHDMFCFIELKDCYPDSALAEIVETVEELYTFEKASIQSMQLDNLKKLREKYPDLPLMFCCGGYTDETAEAVELGFDLDMRLQDIFPTVVSKCHRAGCRFAVWTADTRETVAYALMLGADFIESDYRWSL
ncbi:MAG: glycerophosphodiester phosphodiesterase [Clostridia bacterium]|nr:glycerophosphodiester phosphodiesterase [Clostridia bacterium]